MSRGIAEGIDHSWILDASANDKFLHHLLTRSLPRVDLIRAESATGRALAELEMMTGTTLVDAASAAPETVDLP